MTNTPLFKVALCVEGNLKIGSVWHRDFRTNARRLFKPSSYFNGLIPLTHFLHTELIHSRGIRPAESRLNGLDSLRFGRLVEKGFASPGLAKYVPILTAIGEGDSAVVEHD